MNRSKSSLTPSQSLDYLGMTIADSSFEGFPESTSDPESARSHRRVRLLSSAVAVHLAFSSGGDVVNVLSSRQMRSLQLRLNVAGSLALEDTLVSWDDSCLQDRWWWINVAHLDVGIPLDLPRSDLLLFTDASDVGWGASLGDDQLSGSWSHISLTLSINHQELLAIFLAVLGFLPLLANQSVALFSDNTTSLSYLREEGGTYSSSLNAVAQVILRLCESHAVRLLPQFIPGRLNVLADSLSRGSQVISSKWTLCQEVCRKLFRRWPITIDLFATSPLTIGSPCISPQWAILSRRGLMPCFSLGMTSRLMPFLHLASSPCTGQGSPLLQSGGDARSSLQASQSMVPGSSGVASGGSIPPSFTEGFTQTTPLPSVSSDPPRSSTNWLSYHKRPEQCPGFSSRVAHQLNL